MTYDRISHQPFTISSIKKIDFKHKFQKIEKENLPRGGETMDGRENEGGKRWHLASGEGRMRRCVLTKKIQ